MGVLIEKTKPILSSEAHDPFGQPHAPSGNQFSVSFNAGRAREQLPVLPTPAAAALLALVLLQRATMSRPHHTSSGDGLASPQFQRVSLFSHSRRRSTAN